MNLEHVLTTMNVPASMATLAQLATRLVSTHASRHGSISCNVVRTIKGAGKKGEDAYKGIYNYRSVVVISMTLYYFCKPYEIQC